MNALTLEQWLGLHMPEIKALVDFSKKALSDDAGGLHLDLSRAQQDVGRAGALLADLEAYVTQAEAAAVLSVRAKYVDFSASERKALVEGEIFRVVRMRDALKVVVGALKGKGYAAMNINRSRP